MLSKLPVVHWDKLAASLRAMLAFRYGVLGYVALIVVMAMLILLGSMWLTAAPFYVVVLLIMFLTGIGAILYLTLKAPQVVLMGGPSLPHPARISALAELLNGPHKLTPAERVIEPDPRRALISGPPAPIDVDDRDREPN